MAVEDMEIKYNEQTKSLILNDFTFNWLFDMSKSRAKKKRLVKKAVKKMLNKAIHSYLNSIKKESQKKC